MTIAAVHSPDRRRRSHPLSAAVAALALCLRLVASGLPQEPVAPTAEGDLAALFGEHALCLAAARGETPPGAPVEPAQTPAPRHDCAACCLHTAVEFGAPPAIPAVLVAADDAHAEWLAPAWEPIPRLPNAAARARAPPIRS
jgi:hypothetical protein